MVSTVSTRWTIQLERSFKCRFYQDKLKTDVKKRTQSDRFCLCILQADVFEAIDWFGGNNPMKQNKLFKVLM